MALLIAGALLWLGRRDVTRPAVAFGAAWFLFVAIAQLRLTELETEWSTGFTLVVFGGGLAFVVAATLADGTAPARGALAVDTSAIRTRRLVTAAVCLIAAGVAGAAYKASVLDGIPLLSDNPDVVRGRVVSDGEIVVPAWSSALTNGFYLGMWAVLAALWVVPDGTSRARRAGLWLLALAAFVGIGLEASRNLILFAVAVPALAVYLMARPRRLRTQLAWVAIALLGLGGAIGGLFVLRVERGETSAARSHLEREIARQPTLLKPFVPVYLNGAFPLEAAKRMYDAVPSRRAYGDGANSLLSLPDRAFPEGKANYAGNVAGLMDTGEAEQLEWTVATYQGRLLADAGWQGVILGSLLLGLGLGALHRWARARAGLLPLAVVAYVAYYSGYMIYDNHLSFSVIAVFDLAVVGVVSAYCTGRTDALFGYVRTLARDPSA